MAKRYGTKSKKIFYVDCPSPYAKDDGTTSWENVDVFETRKEAQNFCQDAWGIEPNRSDIFITEGSSEL